MNEKQLQVIADNKMNTTVSKKKLFESIAVGWSKIEPIIITNLALSKPIILEGTHGICKSTLGREISRIFGENSCRCYDATKDDLVSIASVPIPDELAKGNLVFSKHDRSIWDAKVVYIDELMRANKENQNLWLEILEEKSLFGQPLKYEMVIATQNPEGYASNFELDEALLDRFTCVVPIPNLQNSDSDTIKEVLRINVGKRNGCKRDGLNVNALRQIVADVSEQYNSILAKEQLLDVICTFVSEFMDLLLKTESKSKGEDDDAPDKLYISPRRWTHLTETIIGMYAYRLATNGLDSKADKVKALEESAFWSIFYCIATVLKVDFEMLQNIFKKVKVILSEFEVSDVDRIRLDIMKLSDESKLIEYLKANRERVQQLLPAYEIKMTLGKLIKMDNKTTQLDVHELCKMYNTNVYESMGMVVEVIKNITTGYGWYGNRNDNYERYAEAIETFPPSKEIWKGLTKER